MPKQPGQVTIHEAGTLVSGAFFEIRGFASGVIPYAGQDKSWVVIKPDPSSEDLASRKEHYVYGDVSEHWGKERQEYRCPLDAAHLTNSWHAGCTIDLFGGPKTPGFVESLDGPFAAPWVIARLQHTALRGYEIGQVKQLQNGEDLPRLPLFQQIVFLGRNCLRPRIVVGAPNACPFCGRAPLICPGCGTDMWKCGQCGNQTMAPEADPRDDNNHRLRIALAPKAGNVLDGKHWDGGDFVQTLGSGLALTKRALDFFASIKAAPIIARPIRVCTDGMSADQKRQLEEALKPVAIKA